MIALASAPSLGRVMLGPSHVDVVPCHSNDGGKTYTGWDHNPFEAAIKDGYVSSSHSKPSSMTWEGKDR